MSFKKEVRANELDTQISFDNVGLDIRYLQRQIDVLSDKANSAIRTAAAAQSRSDTMINQVSDLREYIHQELEKIDIEDINKTVKKLNDEVFTEQSAKKDESLTYIFGRYWLGNGSVTTQKATLLGKVDAILEHLKLDVDVQPEEIKAAKPVAKKKPVTKKKGKR